MGGVVPARSFFFLLRPVPSHPPTHPTLPQAYFRRLTRDDVADILPPDGLHPPLPAPARGRSRAASDAARAVALCDPSLLLPAPGGDLAPAGAPLADPPRTPRPSDAGGGGGGGGPVPAGGDTTADDPPTTTTKPRPRDARDKRRDRERRAADADPDAAVLAAAAVGRECVAAAADAGDVVGCVPFVAALAGLSEAETTAGLTAAGVPPAVAAAVAAGVADPPPPRAHGRGRGSVVGGPGRHPAVRRGGAAPSTRRPRLGHRGGVAPWRHHVG